MVFASAEQIINDKLINAILCYAEDEYAASEDGQVLRVPHGAGASGRGTETDETAGPTEGATGR